MITTELIIDAIEKAFKRESNLKSEAFDVPMLGSLQIRHLLNNLGSISTKFMEVGSHRGGSFASAVYENHNLKTTVAIDSWLSDETEGHSYMEDFKSNVSRFVPHQDFIIIKQDSFEVDLAACPKGIDFYYFDGSHDYESQRKALTYYLPVLADEFIFCVDDFMLSEVEQGTFDGIKESGCKILFEREFVTEKEYDNESWWRGWYVALLKKKS